MDALIDIRLLGRFAVYRGDGEVSASSFGRETPYPVLAEALQRAGNVASAVDALDRLSPPPRLRDQPVCHRPAVACGASDAGALVDSALTMAPPPPPPSSSSSSVSEAEGEALAVLA